MTGDRFGSRGDGYAYNERPAKLYIILKGDISRHTNSNRWDHSSGISVFPYSGLYCKGQCQLSIEQTRNVQVSSGKWLSLSTSTAS